MNVSFDNKSINTKDSVAITVPMSEGRSLVFTLHGGGMVTELLDRDGIQTAANDFTFEEIAESLMPDEDFEEVSPVDDDDDDDDFAVGDDDDDDDDDDPPY